MPMLRVCVFGLDYRLMFLTLDLSLFRPFYAHPVSSCGLDELTMQGRISSHGGHPLGRHSTGVTSGGQGTLTETVWLLGKCSQISFYYFSISTINANHLVHRQRSMISGPSNALVGHQTRDGMTSYVPEIKRAVGPMRVGMTSYEPQDPAVLLERRNELRASRRGNWY